MLKAIIIAIVVPIVIMSFIPESKWPKPKPKRRTYRGNKSSPKALPWFDKDYLKRKKYEKKKYFWDD